MKLSIYIVLILGSFNVFSQNIEKKTVISKSKSLLIEFASVEKITLNIHDSSDKITISYRDTDDQNVPKINDTDGAIYIKVAKSANKLKGIEKNKYRAGQPLFPTYIINVPKDMNVQLFYDKGNFKTVNFKGVLDLHLDAGTVEIDEFEGELSIESFSGLIHCNVSAAMLNVVSSKGKITSNLQDNRLRQTKTSLNGTYVNANNVLKIKSIHAKVNLKSMLTQK